MFTAALVRQQLSYDAQTGVFTWIARFSRARKHARADVPGTDGYRRIFIAGKYYKAHRVAWLWAHGDWPADQIDHVNLDKTDNRLANLRPADLRLNAGNCRTKRRGLKGATLHKSGKWQAQICSFGKRTYLGLFDSEGAAHQAYARAAATTFGEFARLA